MLWSSFLLFKKQTNKKKKKKKKKKKNKIYIKYIYYILVKT